MNSDAQPRAFWRLASPGLGPEKWTHAGGSALAIIEIHGNCDSALRLAGLTKVAVGGVALRSLPNIDDLLVVRLTHDSCLLIPHGGGAVVRAVCNHLTRRGVAPRGLPDLHPSRPEAADGTEAATLDLIDSVRSPLALAVLLDQPRRWREHRDGGLDLVQGEHECALRRLLAPPLVVSIGPPNVGKSSLLNALARDQLAVVADAPGTTRDAVGVMLDLDGLVFRYADTPGLRRAAGRSAASRDEVGTIDRTAEAAALDLVGRADLLLMCGDPISGFLDEEWLDSLVQAPRKTPRLRLLLRADLLGLVPGAAHTPASAGSDVAISLVSRTSGEAAESGLARLAAVIRRVLLPDDALLDPGAWRFWDS